MPTKIDWEEARKRLNQQTDRQRSYNERLLRQASVDSSLLTSHPAWDKYLEHLQAELDLAKSELRALHEKQGTPLTNEQIHLTYVAINVIGERIRVLSSVMALPKQIITEAEMYKNEQPGSMAQVVASSMP